MFVTFGLAPLSDDDDDNADDVNADERREFVGKLQQLRQQLQEEVTRRAWRVVVAQPSYGKTKTCVIPAQVVNYLPRSADALSLERRTTKNDDLNAADIFFRCVSRVICPPGYALDPTIGQHCLDIDECREGTHTCIKGQICENRPGGYHCLCPTGYVDGPNHDCVDIDECSVYGSHICGLKSRCENTAGSFRCLCEEGFENSRGGGCQVRASRSR